MKFSKERIVRDVKAVMDENLSAPGADALSKDLEQRSMDDVIAVAMVDGVAAVEKVAPIWMVEGIDISGSQITWHEIGKRRFAAGSAISLTGSATATTTAEPANPDQAWWGEIAMPQDMMRLLVFEMSDWDYPVSDVITDQDSRYARQRSPFRGVRGNPNRPVVALHDGRIEFYCCQTKEATITTAQYAAWPKWEDEEIDIPPRLYRAAIYQTAAIVMQELGMSETAKDMAAMVPMMIQ